MTKEPNIKSILEEFDEKFTDGGDGFTNAWIYRDGGKKVIKGMKQFLETSLRQAMEAVVPDGLDEITFGKIEQNISNFFKE